VDGEMVSLEKIKKMQVLFAENVANHQNSLAVNFKLNR